MALEGTKSGGAATATDDAVFILERVFDAPRELVWRAWTDPVQMTKWWGPRMFSNPVCEMDVRPGGKFLIVMRGPAGDDYPFKGEFLEVDAPNRLVYSNDTSEHGEQWHKMVYPGMDPNEKKPDPVTEMTLQDLGGKTRLSIRMRFATQEMLDGHVRVGMYEGWSDSLDALAELVREGSGRIFLQVTRRFLVPAEQVFDAWLDPKGVGAWLFKTPDGIMQRVEIDAREGGRFLVVERRGNVDAEHWGEYLEIDRPRRLVFSFSDTEAFSDPARIEIEIVPVSGGCELTLKHTMSQAFAKYTDQTRTGWAGILAGLARSLGMRGGFFPGGAA